MKPRIGRVRVGSIVEVVTSNGLAYAHVTHVHSTPRSAYGPLLRVLPGFFLKRPATFDELVRQEPVSMMFCALRRALKEGIAELVATVPVPDEAARFPLFRSTNDLWTDGPKDWRFWDGEKSWRVGEITAQQRRMPLAEIVDGTLLRERIETGWNPASDPRFQ